MLTDPSDDGSGANQKETNFVIGCGVAFLPGAVTFVHYTIGYA
jgi:hypothetical protein